MIITKSGAFAFLGWVFLANISFSDSAYAAQQYYVAIDGNDSWTGTSLSHGATDGPFATLSHAVDAARKSGVRKILLESGVYRDNWPIVIGADVDGLTIAAAPSARPILSGGISIAGFQAIGNGIFAADFPKAPGLDVSMNGHRLLAARSGGFVPSDPSHTGWSIAMANIGSPSKTAFQFQDRDIRSSDIGLPLQSIDVTGFLDSTFPLAGIDGQIASLGGTAPYPLHDGARYRVLGNPLDLRFPGQYAWGASDKKLLVIPPSEATSQHLAAVVAGGASLLKITGSGVTLSGLTFEDVSTYTPAVAIADGRQNKIVSNRFIDDGIGVSLSATSGNTISGNLFYSIGRFGIFLQPLSNNNIISQNRLGSIGVTTLFSSGIFISGGNGNRIERNDIRNASRHAIAIIPASADPKLASVDNYIGYNRIVDTMLETSDGAPIYTLGRAEISMRATIEFNDIRKVHGVRTDSKGRWHDGSAIFGVYLDDKSSGVTVRNNFILMNGGEVTGPDTGVDKHNERIGSAAVFVNGGVENTIERNIAVLGGPMQFAWITVAPDMMPKLKDAGSKNTLTSNVIYLRTPQPTYWRYFTSATTISDRNVIVGVPAEAGKSAGFDQASLWQDPGFIDPSTGDYRLKPDSPAKRLGVRDIVLEPVSSP